MRRRLGSVFVAIGLVAAASACGSSSDSRDRNVDAGFLCSQGGFCKVGDTGPAGGIVFVEGLKAGDTAWEAAPLNGFGDYGDDYVRIALIENEQRCRQAVRGIREMFRKDGLLPKAAA